MTRKVIQIVVEPRHFSGGRDFDGGPLQTDSALWLLCNDGTVYFKDYDRRNPEWVEVELPDEVECGDPNGDAPESTK